MPPRHHVLDSIGIGLASSQLPGEIVLSGQHWSVDAHPTVKWVDRPLDFIALGYSRSPVLSDKTTSIKWWHSVARLPPDPRRLRCEAQAFYVCKVVVCSYAFGWRCHRSLQYIVQLTNRNLCRPHQNYCWTSIPWGARLPQETSTVARLPLQQ